MEEKRPLPPPLLLIMWPGSFEITRECQSWIA